MLHRPSGVSHDQRPEPVQRLGASLGGGGAAQRRLPVARRPLAGASVLLSEDALSFQLLEGAVQGAAIRLVAKDSADIVTVEDVRNRGERIHDIVEESPGAAPRS